MPLATGVVEAVSVKELASPDKYENTHRGNVKIGEDWFSFGSFKNGKVGEIFTKKGLITKGAEVEFMYTENGDFKNVQKASVNILKQGNASPAKAQGTGASQSASSGSKKPYVDNTVGIAVGAAMNQAVALHGPVGKNKDVDFDFIEKTACQLHGIAEGLKVAASKGNIAGAVVDDTPPSTNTSDDSIDDDIPPF